MTSPRELVQLAILDKIEPTKFNAPYGIICGKADNQKYRTIAFGIVHTLDAEVRIYGPNFILLKWTTSIKRLPYVGSEKFENVEQFGHFLQNNFL